MRATDPRRAPWTRRAGWPAAFATLAALTGAGACADSLHLDPPGASGSGGGTGSTGSHGSTGTGTTGCVSNPDCTYPKAVCDTVARQCVECLTFADCGDKPGTVCSAGVCSCATEADAAALTYCPASSAGVARCVDTESSASDCGACGHACFGSCSAHKCADKWEPTATAGAPGARTRHVAVWSPSASRMIVWGGKVPGGFTNTGGRYDPVKGTWQPTSTVNAPSERADATAVWDDVENVMIVWGGTGPGGLLGTGGIYDPATDTWKALPLSGAPSARSQHTAVWGSTLAFMGATHGMIVWGGSTSGTAQLADGFLYDPIANAWLPLPAGPNQRGQHTAVWNTSNQMIVFGGFGTDLLMAPNLYLNDSWTFDPSTGWTQIMPTTLPDARISHTAVWAGASMLVFGGRNGMPGFLPDTDKLAAGDWTVSTPTPSPEGRQGHTAVWIGAPTSAMLIFGGDQGGGAFLDTGWSVDAGGVTWKPLPTAPEARSGHTAVVNGTTMIVWGGNSSSGLLASGGIFDTAP
jgi:hypothetical protein